MPVDELHLLTGLLQVEVEFEAVEVRQVSGLVFLNDHVDKVLLSPGVVDEIDG